MSDFLGNLKIKKYLAKLQGKQQVILMGSNYKESRWLRLQNVAIGNI